MTDADGASRTNLDERYGRGRRGAISSRRVAWIAGAAFAAVFGAWVVWGGLDAATGQVDTLDVGHEIVGNTAVSVTYQVSLTPGEAARCALQAQDESHDIVGWKIVDVPASDQRTRKFTEVVRTSELAVTGLIYRCWPA